MEKGGAAAEELQTVGEKGEEMGGGRKISYRQTRVSIFNF